jgi:hypothetical protein
MDASKTSFVLCTGALSDSILDQVHEQGFEIDPVDCNLFQKISRAITLLRIHGYIPESVAKKAGQKLCRNVGKRLKKKQDDKNA